MAYGMRRKYGRRAPMRGARRRLNFRKKVSVPRKKRTARTFVRNNSRAINSLSRDVKYLKMAKYGSVQKNFQTSNLMIPLATQPIIVDIMDFSCQRSPVDMGCRFSQYTTTTPPVLQNCGQWTPSDNLYFSGMNADLPDTGKYLALNCHITMRFQATPSITDCRIRVDLVSVKKVPQVVYGQPVFALPTGLKHLNNLSNPELAKLGGNPYLKVWSTKWLYLSSSQNRATGIPGSQNPGPAVTGNSGYLSFSINPKGGKLRTQQVTAPVVPGDPDVQQDGNWGPYNIGDQTEPLFLIISSSDQTVVGPTPNTVTVQCSRSVAWRDPIGQANL